MVGQAGTEAEADPHAVTEAMTPVGASEIEAPASDARPSSVPASLPGTGPASRLDDLVAREEQHGLRQRLCRVMQLGLLGWMAFLLGDVLVVFVWKEVDRALPYFLARLIPPVLVVPMLLWLRAREAPSARALRAVELATFGIAAAGTSSFAAVHPDGIASYHVMGTLIVALAHGVMIGSPWKKGIWPIGLVIVMPFAVLGIFSLFDPHLAEQWRDPEARNALGGHWGMILGGGLFTLVGGHLMWDLRRQVAEMRSIGRYQLRRRIASGGMGEVWAAYHVGLERDVAVKLIRPRFGSDPRAVARFEREVRTLAELTHPNTVRVFDYGATADGVWYYAMELLDGEHLERLVEREGPLAPGRAVRLTTQAAQALAEAHAAGIVHRDVKPANLLLVRPGSSGEFVKLVDFGIAKSADEDPGLTGTGLVIGTPGYIAPEVARGGPATTRSDVFALGMVLWFLLAGREPFEGDTPQARLLSTIEGDLPSIAEVRDDLDPALVALVDRCLAIDPLEREPDAGALASALRALPVVD
ncbi:MAG TPA: serine/threonine-protein kinase [Sandaracinaceae bacterium LLY-WYZ-13_1]|nr:serine/threonine-protein kinase [Sandaracinaceae bacterium LLY-WYZ-13_1]